MYPMDPRHLECPNITQTFGQDILWLLVSSSRKFIAISGGAGICTEGSLSVGRILVYKILN